ncbi:hypothetical protein GGR51DRAFT_377934 [Nemania sp. FL0031]|nr:hypothetical protein GGR51DRAFT_377934 [Nemania sp. FL0031]
MCLLVDVMCSKTKSKSKTSTKSSKKCPDCKARKIAREELNNMYMAPMPPMPIPMVKQDQFGYAPLYNYSYGDWSSWLDNYPAVISNKQWGEQMKTTQNAYDSAQENGKKIGDAKSTITSEIQEAQKAIKETHASVKNTDTQIKSTQVAIEQAHISIRGAVREAVQKTQDALNEKYAEHLSKQEECAADISRVRQILEEEAKKREDARRVQEMVQYAQSQGLLPTQDHHRAHSSSRSSSPTVTTSTSASIPTLPAAHRRRARAEKEKEEEGDKREWEERWSRAEGELEFLRRRDSYFHPPPPPPARFQGGYFDDVIEPSPYAYVDYGAGHHRGGGVRGPRRVQPRCRAWEY